MIGKIIPRVVLALASTTVACGDSIPAPAQPAAAGQRAATAADHEHAGATAPPDAQPAAAEQRASEIALERRSPAGASEDESYRQEAQREQPQPDAPRSDDKHPAERGHGDRHAAERRPHHPHGHGAGPSGATVGRRFKDAESWARHLDNPRRRGWQKPRHVIALMEIVPGMTVADIGAGTGYFLPYLSAAVGPEGRVLGLDIEPDMVRYMTERADRQGLDNVEARQVSPADPGLAPASVDRVLVVNTWHHIADRGAYAAKLARALEPGGAVYIVDYTLAAKRGPRRSHRLAAAKVIEDLEAGGLAAERIEEKLPHQYIVVGRRR